MANWTCAAYGGSGAGYHAKIAIQTGGNYTITVGTGGTGRGGAKGESPATGTDATGSTIVRSSDSTTIINAGGGTGSVAQGSGATYGTGGILTKAQDLIEHTVYTSTNGQNGVSGGTPGPISGHTWGATGNVTPGTTGSHADPSYHGYVLIKYLGEVPPLYTFTINTTPIDAAVTLTIDGNTYTQKTITTFAGKTIDWTASKAGYETQTGTVTLTANTTEDITLEIAPIYYCYIMRLDSNPGYIMYVYSQMPITTLGTTDLKFTSSGTTRATTSDEVTNTFPLVIESITENGFVARLLEYNIYYTATRDPTGDLYT